MTANHEHTCRACDGGIPCRQTDEECDRNGGIGQYNGQCDDCNQKENASTSPPTNRLGGTVSP